jgi:hypothetical protein
MSIRNFNIDENKYKNDISINIIDQNNLENDISINNDTKISDFNKSILQSNTMYGTPIFSPPETILNNVYHKKSDVYSFGSIIFEIITHEYPWKFNDIESIGLDEFIQLMIQESFKPKIDLSSNKIKSEIVLEFLINLANKCWKLDYKERPTFDEIKFELDQFIKIAKSSKKLKAKKNDSGVVSEKISNKDKIDNNNL